MEFVKLSAASFNRIMKMAKVISAPYDRRRYADNGIVRLACKPGEVCATALNGASVCSVWEPILESSSGFFDIVMPVVNPIRKVKTTDPVLVCSGSNIIVTVEATGERHELEIPEGYLEADLMKLYPSGTPDAVLWFSPKLLAGALSTFDPAEPVKIELFANPRNAAVISDFKRTQKALVLPTRDPEARDKRRHK